ncbi:MAG: DUF547 domain-containing protein [Verrucomicrobiota bacterium]
MRILHALLFCLSVATTQAFDHSDLTEILKKNVQKGQVDYAALANHPDPLDAYLERLAQVSQAEFSSWQENEQIAFLTNLYNATTLQVVAEHYPVETIREIFKGPLTPTAVSTAVWKKDLVSLFGEAISLNHLEHEILRKDYQEPRIHFALVCAAISCPPLRSEAYTGERLGAQMDEQARIFFAEEEKNRLDPQTGTLFLSPIVGNWFKEDFTKTGQTLQEFVTPYFPKKTQPLLRAQRFQIKDTPYDWGLND